MLYSAAPRPVPEPKVEIPEDLICNICKDLFVDAVMIPCCGSSFCDECVRTALLESEDNECPDCFEKGTSPSSLIPNRFLRTSVNNFKSETGYIAPRKPPPRVPSKVEGESKEKVEPDTTTAKAEEDQSPDTNENAKEIEEEEEERSLSPVQSEDEHERRQPHDHYMEEMSERYGRSPESEGMGTPREDDNHYNEPISNIVSIAPHTQPLPNPPYVRPLLFVYNSFIYENILFRCNTNQFIELKDFLRCNQVQDMVRHQVKWAVIHQWVTT